MNVVKQPSLCCYIVHQIAKYILTHACRVGTHENAPMAGDAHVQTNYWSVLKTAEIDPPRPRLQNSSLEQSWDQDRSLEDYISGSNNS